MDKFLWRNGVLYSQSQFVHCILLSDDKEVILPSRSTCYQLHTGMYGGREFKDGKLIHGFVFSSYGGTSRFYDRGKLIVTVGVLEQHK